MKPATPHTASSGVLHPLRHANVLGIPIAAVNLTSALDLVNGWLSSPTGHRYICLACVHSVMESRTDPELRRALDRAWLNLPDGMPMTWVGRLQKHKNMDRVFGPDFMLELCRISVDRGYPHFLYGGRPGVATQLRHNLESRFPGIQIAGTYTPPFRDLTASEERDLVARIRQTKPHILWVGLGAPKQERFMARYVDRLGVPLLVGVGAAFDFHTGRIRDCSPWIKRCSLQWLHRLLQEPRRLWRRYLLHNPAFLWHIAWQLAVEGLRPNSHSSSLVNFE
jgi:N-acetylglucosaminyldiphosphoundecaprenol N-acetyl-beta-D-mannosaminyltransferase